MDGADDPSLLEWAAQQGRIVLTRDVATIADFAYQRVESGLPMPGVFEIPGSVAIGTAIAELVLIVEVSEPDEWKDKVTYLPLR